jgi:gluconate 2-dehydrogenase gamma chain
MKPHDKFLGPSVTRRTFIASAALIPVAAFQNTPQAAAQTTAPVTVFTAEQRRILSAFVDRLIPKDELGPSATECGVHDYIDGCLADFLAAEKPSFLEGLAAVDAFARASQGAPLVELSAEKQDAVLTAIDNNQAPNLKAFFNRVRRLTLEGMFGDPSYGGNKDFAGWDLIRYPGAKLMSTPQDQKMSVAPVPYRKALYADKGDNHGH